MADGSSLAAYATSQPNNKNNYHSCAHCVPVTVLSTFYALTQLILTHAPTSPLGYGDYYDPLLATDETYSGLLLITQQVSGEART